MKFVVFFLHINKDVISLAHTTLRPLFLIVHVLKLKSLVDLRMFMLMVANDFGSIDFPDFLVPLRQFHPFLFLFVILHVLFKNFLFFLRLIFLQVLLNDLIHTLHKKLWGLITRSLSPLDLHAFFLGLLMGDGAYITLQVLKQIRLVDCCVFNGSGLRSGFFWREVP